MKNAEDIAGDWVGWNFTGSHLTDRKILANEIRKYAHSAIEKSLRKASDKALLEKAGLTIEQWQMIYKAINDAENIITP